MKLQYDEALSNFAFEFDVRRYTEAAGAAPIRGLTDGDAEAAKTPPPRKKQKVSKAVATAEEAEQDDGGADADAEAAGLAPIRGINDVVVKVGTDG